MRKQDTRKGNRKIKQKKKINRIMRSIEGKKKLVYECKK